MSSNDEFILEYSGRWTAISEQLPDEDVPVLVTNGSDYETACWIMGEDGEPVWYLDGFEVDLPWQPLWWTEHPPMPQRREVAESGYMVGEDYEDDDGYDCFKQYDEKGNCIFWTLHGYGWDAFDDNDPDALDPFFDSYIINDAVLDEAWQLLMQMKEAKK